MGGQYHGSAVRLILLQDKIPDGKLRHRVQSDGRFVKEQNPRPVQKRSGDLTAHPLSEGKLSGRRAQKFC